MARKEKGRREAVRCQDNFYQRFRLQDLRIRWLSQETFINETKILRNLKNDNIVALESLYIAKKELISVLEYLNGGTLLEELREVEVG